MSQTNDKKPEFDKEKWGEDIEKGASLNRWDTELLGPPMETYRDHLKTNKQREFIEGLADVFSNGAIGGKRLADYRAEIDKKTTDEATQAIWFDQVQFYKEIEEALKTEHKKPPRREKRTVLIVPKPPNRRPSEPIYINPEILGIVYDKIVDWLFKKKLPKEIRKLGDEKKLQELLEQVYEHYDEIDELNAEIFLMKNNLSNLEQKLVENKGTDSENRIRRTITKQQNAIRENMAQRAQVLAEKTNPKEVLSIKLMKAVKKALKEESKKINEQFGTKIAKLFRDRQVLINQVTMIGHESLDSLAKKFELQSKIEKIDIELNKLKAKLIKYKSKRPIFLFERLVGVKSIPLVYRNGQSSTLNFDFNKEKED